MRQQWQEDIWLALRAFLQNLALTDVPTVFTILIISLSVRRARARCRAGMTVMLTAPP